MGPFLSVDNQVIGHIIESSILLGRMILPSTIMTKVSGYVAALGCFPEVQFNIVFCRFMRLLFLLRRNLDRFASRGQIRLPA
jgi:hypothetical protein